MAGIDKIYGTYQQWCEFHNWVSISKRPQYCQYFYPTPTYGQKGAIAQMPKRADRWLRDNCPIKFVQKRLKEQYKDNLERI